MGKRLSIGRIAAIGAWTGGAVAWGVAAVAIANDAPAAEPVTAPPIGPQAVVSETILVPSIPAIPDSGLVVVRYTPAAIPEAEVIVEHRVVQAPATATAAAAPRAKSSGS
jgi:hypothetical protein